jgi:hypothetical protein
MNSGSGINLGVCKRKAICEELVCYASGCVFQNKELDKLQLHIQNSHNKGKQVTIQTYLYPSVTASIPLASVANPRDKGKAKEVTGDEREE